MKWITLALIVSLLASCAPANTPEPVLPTAVAKHTVAPSVTPHPTPTRAPTWTPGVSATPAGSVLVQDQYTQYTIGALRVHAYGGGQVEDLGVMTQNGTFTRHSIRYKSDGLNIYGFVNVPRGNGPFPVIVMIHGFVDPATYQTLDYTTDLADAFASNGYLVLHPNLRNFPPSDNGDAMFRAGYAIDVLNLIALMRENSGKPGLFEKANAARIGLWGHSLGGEIALKVAVVAPYINAVLLYSSLSGDEKKNSQLMKILAGTSENLKELQAPDQVFDAVSPDRFYRDIHAAVQLHQGTADTTVPVAWAKETCQKLGDVGVDLRCFYYQGAEHTFVSRYWVDFGPRTDVFFQKYLLK